MAGCVAAPGKRFVQGQLRHAGIGVGGMGASDLEQLSKHEAVEITALCDVDATKLAEAHKLHPNAKTFRDWREMFASDPDLFDSVHVSTPDHMHAQIAMEAVAHRKHVYCQKPLTRTVAEARHLTQAAERAGVVTQMGIQNHSNERYASAKALFDAGHIGQVYSAHVWTDRPKGWWPQGVDRPEGEDPIPKDLDWNLWLGVAPVRPYKKGQYHPFAWRGWKDFGTGAQGDMGCHLMDPAIWFLGLGHPSSLRSDGPRPNRETYPLYSRVEYEFPPTPMTTKGPLKLTWHDGGKRVYREILEAQGFFELEAVKAKLAAGEDPLYANACLFLGTRGALLASPYEPPILMGHEMSDKIPVPEVQGTNHWFQFVDACRGKGQTSAPFSYAGPMTEVALLGNIALHFPHEKLLWEGERMQFRGHEAATAKVYPDYRDDWA